MTKKIAEWVSYLLMFCFYKSPWGAAMSLLIWKMYKETPVYKERVDKFGEKYAAREFRWQEYIVLRDMLFHNNMLLKLFIFSPYNVINALQEVDVELRQHIDFRSHNGN